MFCSSTSLSSSIFLPHYYVSPTAPVNKHSIVIRSYKRSKSPLRGSSTLIMPLRRNVLSVYAKKDYGDQVDDELPQNVMHLLTLEETTMSSRITKHVETIRGKFRTMGDGEISISPYDTAWVALIKHVDNGADKVRPQFPSCLRWIYDNQLPDGSWGDERVFSAYDRLLNTLACLIALESWDVHPDAREKGKSFINENIHKLESEKAEQMTSGFEVIFPTLIEIAKTYGIEVMTDFPAMEEINEKRRIKLTRIPKEIMHTIPTSLLISLEGMKDLDWERLLKLRCQDGSFLFCPSTTAYAFMQTNDPKCLQYLDMLVKRFNGGVPVTYPVDIYDRLWVVDRLQRLGISRHFHHEIRGCMSHVYRYWTDRGLYIARNTNVEDVDSTSMGFRLLRLHGYNVSADVFKNFEEGGQFFCFFGQTTQTVTGMCSLLRASQLQFPGETILERARAYSSSYLTEKRSSNQLLDKWVIAKDLPGEVGCALDIPWYANLPRVETRFYIEQYGGEDDVWIAKLLYRMPNISNNVFLELAKLDFNSCQALHRLEWANILRWHIGNDFADYGVSKKSLLEAYFVAAASIFEPERSKERLAWVKTATLIQAIASTFGNENHAFMHGRRENFVEAFQSTCGDQSYPRENTSHSKELNSQVESLVRILVITINQLSLDTLAMHGKDNQHQLCQAWGKWLRVLWEEEEEGNKHKGEAELLVRVIELCSPRCPYEDVFSQPDVLHLLGLANQLCLHLRDLPSQNSKVHNETINGSRRSVRENAEVEHGMQELARLALSDNSDDAKRSVKQTILAVVKTFYYKAYCPPLEKDHHIAKVLFHKVE